MSNDNVERLKGVYEAFGRRWREQHYPHRLAGHKRADLYRRHLR